VRGTFFLLLGVLPGIFPGPSPEALLCPVSDSILRRHATPACAEAAGRSAACPWAPPAPHGTVLTRALCKLSQAPPACHWGAFWQLPTALHCCEHCSLPQAAAATLSCSTIDLCAAVTGQFSSQLCSLHATCPLRPLQGPVGEHGCASCAPRGRTCSPSPPPSLPPGSRTPTPASPASQTSFTLPRTPSGAPSRSQTLGLQTCRGTEGTSFRALVHPWHPWALWLPG